jgi:hypothetical protein
MQLGFKLWEVRLQSINSKEQWRASSLTLFLLGQKLMVREAQGLFNTTLLARGKVKIPHS